jgi:hypothetical protein
MSDEVSVFLCYLYRHSYLLVLVQHERLATSHIKRISASMLSNARNRFLTSNVAADDRRVAPPRRLLRLGLIQISVIFREPQPTSCTRGRDDNIGNRPSLADDIRRNITVRFVYYHIHEFEGLVLPPMPIPLHHPRPGLNRTAPHITTKLPTLALSSLSKESFFRLRTSPPNASTTRPVLPPSLVARCESHIVFWTSVY